MEETTCRDCEQKIIYIETIKGKQMPCEPEYIATDEADPGMMLTTEDGYSFRVDGPNAYLHEGGYDCHIPHCTGR